MPTLTTDAQKKNALQSSDELTAWLKDFQASDVAGNAPLSQHAAEKAFTKWAFDHLEEAGTAPLDNILDSASAAVLRDKIKEYEKENQTDKEYTITAALAENQADEEQEAKDEAQREYDAHVLSAQELVQFNESVTQYRDHSQRNHTRLDEVQRHLDHEQKDIQSREITVNGHHYALNDKTGKYYDVDNGKDVDPSKDPALAAQLDKLHKPGMAKKSEIDAHDAKQKTHDDLQQRQTADDNGVNDASNKDPKTGKDQSTVNDANKDANDIDKKITQLQATTADVTKDRKSQINVANNPSGGTQTPSAPPDPVANTENKKVREYNDTHQEKRANEEDRLKKLSSNESADSSDALHSMFANYKTNGNQQNTSQPPTNARTGSFASSQSGLSSDTDDRLQKLAASMQTAFTAGAQGNTPPAVPGNTPTLANNAPQPSPDKRPVAPAMV